LITFQFQPQSYQYSEEMWLHSYTNNEINVIRWMAIYR